MSDHLLARLRELVLLPSETEWAEFKLNKADPEDIGGYISALSNGAALTGQASGWMAWGVDDVTHSLEGTSFDPAKTKVGGEDLEAWLAWLLVPQLKRKALRVIVYADRDRTKTVKEQVGRKGYSVGFEGAIEFINALLPMNEVIGKALRREVRMFPEIAIRELVANALIHQDFSIIGSGPMVEIFSDRIEITNPGAPLIEAARLLDLPPKSRNEDLAAFMRRINICEERGSGIDKVIRAVEEYQLPPPDFRTPEDNTRVILYGLREHSEMSPEERIRACYQHACLLYESGGQKMTNATLRERLGIKAENYPMASRVISLAKKEGLIKDAEPGSSKNAAYLPFYA